MGGCCASFWSSKGLGHDDTPSVCPSSLDDDIVDIDVRQANVPTAPPRASAQFAADADIGGAVKEELPIDGNTMPVTGHEDADGMPGDIDRHELAGLFQAACVDLLEWGPLASPIARSRVP